MPCCQPWPPPVPPMAAPPPLHLPPWAEAAEAGGRAAPACGHAMASGGHRTGARARAAACSSKASGV
eukprot:3084305-Prymnesium_polylepis.4